MNEKIKCENCGREIKKSKTIFWKKYCSNNCRQRAWYKRNLKKAVTLALLLLTSTAFAETGKASWYSTEACKYNPEKHCPTADGSSLYALEEKEEIFAAYNDAPLGTRVRVTNKSNGKHIIAIVRDRGGFKKYSRIIDLSRHAFIRLAPLSQGVVEVEVSSV